VKTLVVGIGSTIRGDDGVGVHAVRRLQLRDALPDVDIVELGTAGLALLDIVEGYDRLIVLDAIESGAPPGTVRVLSGEDVARATHLGVGHEADLPATLALGRELGDRQMPEEVVVIAVEAGDIHTFSEQLTPGVEAAVERAVGEVAKLVGMTRLADGL
jgi:hydrogenase maturation protease